MTASKPWRFPWMSVQMAMRMAAYRLFGAHAAPPPPRGRHRARGGRGGGDAAETAGAAGARGRGAARLLQRGAAGYRAGLPDRSALAVRRPGPDRARGAGARRPAAAPAA